MKHYTILVIALFTALVTGCNESKVDLTKIDSVRALFTEDFLGQGAVSLPDFMRFERSYADTEYYKGRVERFDVEIDVKNSKVSVIRAVSEEFYKQNNPEKLGRWKAFRQEIFYPLSDSKGVVLDTDEIESSEKYADPYRRNPERYCYRDKGGSATVSLIDSAQNYGMHMTYSPASFIECDRNSEAVKFGFPYGDQAGSIRLTKYAR